MSRARSRCSRNSPTPISSAARCARSRATLMAPAPIGTTSRTSPPTASPLSSRSKTWRSSTPISRRTQSLPSPASRNGLEIQIGVVLGWRRARDVVGQERPETRPRLDAGIPFLGGLVLIPGHVAEVVEGREVRGRGNVGQREMIAREPAAALDQESDVVEVIAEIGLAGADRARIGLAQPQEPLHHLLADQRIRDFAIELAVEPLGEPAHLRAVERIDADQQLVAIDLVKELRDGIC